MSQIHCKVCGCEFSQVREKEDHMLKFHTEIKCTMCEYNAFGESGLKEHQRNKHNPLTWNITQKLSPILIYKQSIVQFSLVMF